LQATGCSFLNGEIVHEEQEPDEALLLSTGETILAIFNVLNVHQQNPHILKNSRFITGSPQPITGPYPTPDEYIQHSPTLFL
jgi:hypothetical protein